MKTQEAVKTLAKALRKDKGFYYSYQANIAMAFIDVRKKHNSRNSYRTDHSIANEGAVNFLNLLIKEAQ